MRYRVVASVHGSKYLGEYEAESPEEAVEKALNSDAAYVSFCHQCSDQCENAECVEATADPVEPK